MDKIEKFKGKMVIGKGNKGEGFFLFKDLADGFRAVDRFAAVDVYLVYIDNLFWL